MSGTEKEISCRPAGYAALIERYDLDVISNWHRSYIASANIHRVALRFGIIEEEFPYRYWPGEDLGDHLEFALKYDGINLAILDSLFVKLAEEDFIAYLRSRPTGKYARRLWFLYEFLTGKTLPLDDIKKGNYIDLLESDKYYAIDPGIRIQRQRINNNLPGNRQFCPIIRRTDELSKLEKKDFYQLCCQMTEGYSTETLKRAFSYLYTKETKSSFEIEHVKPTSNRIERFINLLHQAEDEDFCEKGKLIELQNHIVDPRFHDSDYRINQNYIGETVTFQKEKIHFVGPKPESVPSLMEGLLTAHKQMAESTFSVVVHAAVIAYGFVFIHPFEDGNGRIHRFLLHNILSRRGLTPKGFIFPLSAAMLKKLDDYTSSLEAFSRQLMSLVDYSLDADGHMTVHNDTGRWYQYIDMTPQVETLFRFIEQTIEIELKEELYFLARYDTTKSAIQEIVDMPDRQIDLFIRFCLQNNGRLSRSKRTGYFDFLTEEEVSLMEQSVQKTFNNNQ